MIELPSAIWHVIGNGPGSIQCDAAERRVRFNQPVPSQDPTCLTISNGRVSGNSDAFAVSGGLPDEAFIARLSAHAKELSLQLGCWPSCGLVALSCLLEQHSQLKVSAMDLLPSLVRSDSLGVRQPLPAAFHNWLGERRLAQSWLPRLEWPAFWLECTSLGGEESDACFERLIALPFMPREGAMMEWQSLAAIDVRAWCENADVEKLNAIEGMFFLPRGQLETKLWWMYDSEASIHVNQVRFALALAQQELQRAFPVVAY